MLERSWKTITTQFSPDSGPGREFISLADVTLFFRRYIVMIFACVIIGVTGAAFYIATTDPTYTARTQILIEPKISQLLQQQASDVNLSLDTAQVESQIAVMQSEKIALMVIKELDLYNNRFFNQSRNPTLVQRVRKLLALAEESFALEEKPWFQAIVKHLEPARDEQPMEPSEFEESRRTMAIFRDGLDVRRVGVSYAIDISFSARNAQTAADIANAMATAFVREQIENKAAAAREGGAWLERRLKELRTQMNTATQIAQEFRAKHDYTVGRQMVLPSGGKGAGEQEGSSDADVPTLEELEVTADTHRKMYESFLSAYTSSVSQQSYPVADARVITPATRPLLISQPRRNLILALGSLAGAMIGLGLAFTRHMRDRTFRSARQIRESLGLDCIGELPPVSRRRGFGRINEVMKAPRSQFTDSLRSVLTAISLADVAQPIRRIGIASALPGEGKSSCAGNLATLYAMAGFRTLVIDADVHHAALTVGLFPEDRRKTIDLEWRHQSIADLIRPAGAFDLLPSSAVESRNLLSSKNLQCVLPELDAYDIVIVDLPPLTAGPEKLAISSLLDGVVIVVEWGKTSADPVIELSRSFQANKAPIIGALLTKARVVSTRRYSRYNSRAAY